MNIYMHIGTNTVTRLTMQNEIIEIGDRMSQETSATNRQKGSQGR